MSNRTDSLYVTGIRESVEEYFGIDLEIVWHVVCEDLPTHVISTKSLMSSRPKGEISPRMSFRPIYSCHLGQFTHVISTEGRDFGPASGGR
jgi:hypothetical protein